MVDVHSRHLVSLFLFYCIKLCDRLSIGKFLLKW